MAEVQDAGNTNLLKRSLPDTENLGLELGLKSQRTDGVETDNSGDTAVALQELEDIAENIAEILDHAEKEKERIARESTEAVQHSFQERARILEQLPGFWGVALRQSLAGDYLTHDDDKLLEYLVSVDVATIENGLQITLCFADDNPYLESTEMIRLATDSGAMLPEVTWKPGQELSPTTDESGSGAFDSCNFFQRFASMGAIDTVDQIIHDVFWSPMQYYKGTADLAEERQRYASAYAEEEEEYELEPEEEAVVEEGLEEALEQEPAAVQEDAGSDEDEEADSDAEDVPEEFEDQEGEEEDDGDDADADADGDAL